MIHKVLQKLWMIICLTLKLSFSSKKLYSKFHYFKLFISRLRWSLRIPISFKFLYRSLRNIIRKKFSKYMDSVTSMSWEKLLGTCFCCFLKWTYFLLHQGQVVHRFENLHCNLFIYISIILQLLHLCTGSFGLSLLLFKYLATHKNCKKNVMI